MCEKSDDCIFSLGCGGSHECFWSYILIDEVGKGRGRLAKTGLRANGIYTLPSCDPCVTLAIQLGPAVPR